MKQNTPPTTTYDNRLSMLATNVSTLQPDLMLTIRPINHIPDRNVEQYLMDITQGISYTNISCTRELNWERNVTANKSRYHYHALVSLEQPESLDVISEIIKINIQGSGTPTKGQRQEVVKEEFKGRSTTTGQLITMLREKVYTINYSQVKGRRNLVHIEHVVNAKNASLYHLKYSRERVDTFYIRGNNR